MSRVRCWARTIGSQEGNAQVEFIGWVVAVLVPVVYLVVALAGVQAASFATTAGAQAAARMLITYRGEPGLARARSAVSLALTDQRIDAAEAARALTVECERPGCAGGQAVVRVAVGVDLPVLSAVGLGRDVLVVDAVQQVRLPAGPDQP